MKLDILTIIGAVSPLIVISIVLIPFSLIQLEFQHFNTDIFRSKINEKELNIDDAFNTTFDSKVDQFMVDLHSPSLAISIVYKDEVVWSKGYGEQNQSDTVYWIASISKTFAGIAFLQLYEQGVIDLDDDVNNYLSYSLRNPMYPDTPVTIRHLLAHQSGLRDEDVGVGTSEKYWFNRKPGEGFSYSSPGYYHLEALFEVISNQTFEQYVLNHITTPLNMMNTKFRNFNETQLAWGYEWNPTQDRNAKLPPYVGANALGPEPYMSGGLASTALDLTHYLIAHMNDGSYKGIQILNETNIALMHTDFGQNEGYGLGWFTRLPLSECGRFTNQMNWEDNWNCILEGHAGGGLAGFRTYMYFDRAKDLGIILLMNQGFHLFPEGSSISVDFYNFIFQTAYQLVDSSTTIPTTSTEASTRTTTTTSTSTPALTVPIILVIFIAVTLIRKKKK